jgi:hypothetical protein
VSEDDFFWPQNYYNYYTEVEDHFQITRGTALFRLSPLDWALLETWKNSGVPLEAVKRGIDVAFEKWRKRRIRTQQVNGLAFCAQAVMAEAEAMARAGTGQPSSGPVESAFKAEEVRSYLESCAAGLRAAGRDEFAASMERLAAEADYSNLEQLEQRLSAMEEKLIAQLKSEKSEEDLFVLKRELDEQLRPYRGKMSAPQLSMLERQYMDRRLFESARVPRLSLFYMR